MLAAASLASPPISAWAVSNALISSKQTVLDMITAGDGSCARTSGAATIETHAAVTAKTTLSTRAMETLSRNELHVFRRLVFLARKHVDRLGPREPALDTARRDAVEAERLLVAVDDPRALRHIDAAVREVDREIANVLEHARLVAQIHAVNRQAGGRILGRRSRSRSGSRRWRRAWLRARSAGGRRGRARLSAGSRLAANQRLEKAHRNRQ